MQIKPPEAPATTNERTELQEPRRLTISAGQKLVIATVGVTAVGMILYGISSKIGLFGDANIPPPPPPKPVSVDTSGPNLSIPLTPPPQVASAASAAAPSTSTSEALCNGQRLPPGMPCDGADSRNQGGSSGQSGRAADAHQPAASAAHAGGGGQGVPWSETLRARRLSGEITVADGLPRTQAEPKTTGRSAPSGTRLGDAVVAQLDEGASPVTVSPSRGGTSPGPAPLALPPSSGLEARLAAVETPSVRATYTPNLDLLMAKGTLADCELRTALRTGVAGFVQCVLAEPIYSANGRVVLMDPGTIINGEYDTSVPIGAASVFAKFTDAHTPHGVNAQFNSPGTDALGRAGLSGQIDNKWAQRYSGAIAYSIFDDAMNIAAARAARSNGNNNFTQFSSTSNTSRSIVEEQLKQGSNAKSEILKNQGEIVKIIIARDIDFSGVYRLQPVQEAAQ